ncbi:MAG: hypothetical protein WAN79_11585 [Opitutaceae bacterium]
MKAVIVILVLMTVAAAIAAVTGVEHVSWIGHGAVVTHHSLGGRFAAAAVGVICGIAAYGCRGKKMYAWWIVTTMLVLLAGYGVVWTIWKMTTTQMDFLGNMLGSLGEGAKIAALIWFLVAWWIPKKAEFNRAKSEGISGT